MFALMMCLFEGDEVGDGLSALSTPDQRPTINHHGGDASSSAETLHSDLGLPVFNNRVYAGP